MVVYIMDILYIVGVRITVDAFDLLRKCINTYQNIYNPFSWVTSSNLPERVGVIQEKGFSIPMKKLLTHSENLLLRAIQRHLQQKGRESWKAFTQARDNYAGVVVMATSKEGEI